MKENFYVGCDISKASIDVCVHHERHRPRSKQYPNSAKGHEQLIEWITRTKARVRLVMEATGNYSIDFALALDAHAFIELMVANPSSTRQFAC